MDFSTALFVTAAGIGVTHTLLGPDHYLPFIMLARARGWSWYRTLTITAVCGTGHVIGSVALGAVGLAVGAAVAQVEAVEIGRGDWAAWLLIGFGTAYGLWGVRRAIRSKKGIEPHEHGGHVHVHCHGRSPHKHGNDASGSRATFGP